MSNFAVKSTKCGKNRFDVYVRLVCEISINFRNMG